MQFGTSNLEALSFGAERDLHFGVQGDFSGMWSHPMKYELVELKLNYVFQIFNNYIEGIRINYFFFFFFKENGFKLALKQLEVRNYEPAMLSCSWGVFLLQVLSMGQSEICWARQGWGWGWTLPSELSSVFFWDGVSTGSGNAATVRVSRSLWWQCQYSKQNQGKTNRQLLLTALSVLCEPPEAAFWL